MKTIYFKDGTKETFKDDEMKSIIQEFDSGRTHFVVWTRDRKKIEIDKKKIKEIK